MRILLACRRLSRDDASARIRASKWLLALAEAGYDVDCVTVPGLREEERGALMSAGAGPVRISTVEHPGSGGLWCRLDATRRSLASRGGRARRAAEKGDALIAYCTGWHAEFWKSVWTWRNSLRWHCANGKPDVILVHGAGASFEPHVAMLQTRLGPPWIANYHDPYPVSMYPEPYRHRTPLLSWRQERIHRRILERADALTFPSQRLLEWVLQGPLARHRFKAFVLPHIASTLPLAGDPGEVPLVDPNNFNIVHAGTLLSVRKPDALINGFLRFVGDDSERKARARLIFVGGVKPNVARSAVWQKAVGEPCVVTIDQRAPYAAAMRLMELSVAGVVLEADAAESPFFPGKLSDICFLNKPVLALTPARSAVRDMLGADYPLLALPASAGEVHEALELLWRCWKERRLAELAPPQALRHSLTPSAVMSRFREVAEWALSRAREKAG